MTWFTKGGANDFDKEIPKDKYGHIVDGKYGKILAPIKYGLSGERHRLIFAYYLNPDNTRNLEYDHAKNMISKQHPYLKVWRP